MDTGCPYDLVCENSLMDEDLDMVEHSVPVSLQTANGERQTTETVPQQISKIGLCHPYVLPSTPDVLSIGYRCVEEGYGFWWPPFSRKPVLTKPSGRDIK